MILGSARQGVSMSAIARRAGNDRKTIRRNIDRGPEPPAYRPREPGPSLIRPFEAFLRELALFKRRFRFAEKAKVALGIMQNA